MKNLFLIKFLFLFLFINYQVAYANWLDDVWGNITAQGGSTIQNQGAVGFSGGSFTMATPSAPQHPFNVSGPNISAGCSGISIDMGAFQYNEDAIVNFLKGLIQQAPGYTFNLAMQVLCPSCTDLLNTLNQMSGIINGMQLDSCAVLNAAGNALSEKLANSSIATKIGNGKDNMFNNAVSVMNSAAKEVSNNLDYIVGCVNKPDDCPVEFFRGEQGFFETLWKNLEKDTIFKNNIIEVFGEDNFKKILYSLLGDIYIEKTGTPNDGEDYRVGYTSAIYISNEGVGGLINLLTHGNKDDIKINKNPKYKDSINIPVVTIGTNGRKIGQEQIQIIPIIKQANNTVDEIYAKFTNRNELEPTDLNFLMMFQSPVYKFLNQYSIDDTLLKKFTDNFKIVAGYQLTYEYISVIVSNFFYTISDIKSQIEKAGLIDHVLTFRINEMEKKLQILQKAAYDNYLESYHLFSTEMNRGADDMKLINQYKNAYMSRHPIISDSHYAKKLY